MDLLINKRRRAQGLTEGEVVKYVFNADKVSRNGSFGHVTDTLNHTRASQIFMPNATGKFESFTPNTPAITNLGLKISPEVTNLLKHSIDYTQIDWVKSSSITISADAAFAPDGTVSADKITPSTAGSFIKLIQNTAFVAGLTYTQYYIVKSTGLQFIQIIGSSAVFGNFYTNFDLQNGNIATLFSGNSVNLSADITPFTNGYFLIRVTLDAIGTQTGGLAINFIKTSTTARGVNEGAFNGTDGIYVWAAQLEQSTYANAPVITGAGTGASASIVAYDDISNIDLTNGAFFIKFKWLTNNGLIYGGEIAPTIGQNKACLSWAGATLKIFLNGFLATTTTLTAANMNLNELYFGNDGVAKQANMNVISATLYETTLSDAQCLKVTTL